MTNQPDPTISRTYRGKKGTKAFQQDAENLARRNYIIASQVQTPGGRTSAASLFVILGVLFLVLGFLLFPLWAVALVCLVIGLASGKGPNELAVVWKYAAPAQVASAAQAVAPQAPIAPSPPPSDPLATLRELASLRDQGAITAEEFDAKKADLLGRL